MLNTLNNLGLETEQDITVVLVLTEWDEKLTCTKGWVANWGQVNLFLLSLSSTPCRKELASSDKCTGHCMLSYLHDNQSSDETMKKIFIKET